MQDSLDAPPSLSVRAVSPERERWDMIGRLYHKPNVDLPDNYQSLPVLRELVKTGVLVPSVTNVIGVKNSPFLTDWAAKLVANEAVAVSTKWATLIHDKPQNAFYYLKDTAYRELTHWGTQGTRIHYACEMLARGNPLTGIDYTEYEQKCIDSFKKWLNDYQPVFNQVEIQGFGTTSQGLGYAGTADWHVTIDGVNILGDTKCTTLDTKVLLASGAYKEAKDIKVGDLIVSWDEQKNSLVKDTVTEVQDNGSHVIHSVITEFGQKVDVTANHKFLVKKDASTQVWKRADQLLPTDIIYSACGWSFLPERTPTNWPYNKHLSPYTLGFLWALNQYNSEDWTDGGKVGWVKSGGEESLEILKDWGFFESADHKIRVKTGLRRVAHKARIEISELLELLNSPTLPEFILSAELDAQEAFLSGIQNVFGKEKLNPKMPVYFITTRNVNTLKDLQTLFFNNGYPVWLGKNKQTNTPVLQAWKKRYQNDFKHGLLPTRIKGLKKSEDLQPTIAITVAKTHNHVTNGIITHNTNKSGLHSTIALQLAANKNMESICADGKTLITPPKTDMTAGLHLSPSGYSFKEVTTDEYIYKTFESLRFAWDFHAFDGSLHQTDKPLISNMPLQKKQDSGLTSVTAETRSAWD